ncbi:S-adenosylmethionine sensor upstream of mTORC1-like [Saccoglossus kowalevskii]|uniref:S-adenosylmethionine sensor upstream of mTORC1 n=1 Tax=Saccoglossus kowalevskii TaxID=10224 RepID=A0ABM0MR40_SACKO|nr:PREDICTED: probable methyltransferase BTM2 homolog [Saccoglossus kowalevskii]
MHEMQESNSRCSCCSECSDKECQENAAGVVKQVHARLRRKFKEADGDFERIWSEHCEDEDTLEEYANAMQHLAEEHWSKNPDDRIAWCYQCCIDYFFSGGLKCALEKDERTKQFLTSGGANNFTETQCSCTADEYAAGSGDNLSSLSAATALYSYNSFKLPFTGKVRLIDVGSCYNPFLKYEDFLSIGIDISPAVESVYKCDFLNLQLHPPLQLAEDTLDTYLKNLKNPVDELPRESFHVVVFSLLLSYFPSPYQRWICCQKAHSLLQMNGLLLIITPDSSHQNKHASMMKSWKCAIESMGFKRWRYIKYMHMHFMAFRKVSNQQSILMSEANPDMMYIPQDFHDNIEECVFNDSFDNQSDSDEQSVKDFFTELPDIQDPCDILLYT